MLMRVPFFMSWLIFCCCCFRKSACMTLMITDLIATRMLIHVFCSSSPASFSGFLLSLTCLSTCLIHSSLLLPSPLILCFYQLLSSLSSPPHSAFPHLPSFSQAYFSCSLFPQVYSSVPFSSQSFAFSPFSSFALFFFPPRPLTKLNPSSTQMHSISFINTHVVPNM